LAELFLKSTPPDVTGGTAHSFSLFFDMNVLFEEYIGRMAVRTFRPLGYQVTLQGPQKQLAYDENQKRAAFAMKPDVVGQQNGLCAWIIDTKWKPLAKKNSWNPLSTEQKDFVSQQDFYQMYAYANSYDCPEVILLYPHYKELGLNAGVRGSYLLNPWVQEVMNSNRKRVKVVTIDLSNLKAVVEQLKGIILADNLVADAVSL
jgi:5-methylcytosine-specific restriction enzyme subunit McrC